MLIGWLLQCLPVHHLQLELCTSLGLKKPTYISQLLVSGLPKVSTLAETKFGVNAFCCFGGIFHMCMQIFICDFEIKNYKNLKLIYFNFN